MRIPLTVVAFFVGLVPGTAQAPPAADELARRIQADYAAVRTFTARFTQTYEDAIFKKMGAAEKGELKLEKPSRFRMVYTDPERKVFVADGAKLYSYFPADKLGSIDAIPQDEGAPTALLFIAGRGNLVTDFTAALAATQPDGEWHLELTPRRAQPEFRILTLMVDRRTLDLKGFSWTDPNGGITTTRLTEMRTNVPIPPREFTFTFPPGTYIER